jgi:hypothetical protein
MNFLNSHRFFNDFGNNFQIDMIFAERGRRCYIVNIIYLYIVFVQSKSANTDSFFCIISPFYCGNYFMTLIKRCLRSLQNIVSLKL